MAVLTSQPTNFRARFYRRSLARGGGLLRWGCDYHQQIEVVSAGGQYPVRHSHRNEYKAALGRPVLLPIQPEPALASDYVMGDAALGRFCKYQLW